jgi:hypothetical protein
MASLHQVRRTSLDKEMQLQANNTKNANAKQAINSKGQVNKDANK